MWTAIYLRTSTNRQEKGLEAQRRELIAYCRDKGIDEYQIYEDAGVSGAKSKRPALDALMIDCRQGKVKTVIVYSFSRFARSTVHLLAALEEFQRLNVGFISQSENLDTTSAMGRAFFTIISAISQLERELVSERVRVGLNNAKAKGKRIGRPKTRPSELIRALRREGRTYQEIGRLAKCSQGAITDELKSLSTEKEAHE